ncbi:hypothetical protein ACNOYE_27165 [Nannocystaceae bacterium ST9]
MSDTKALLDEIASLQAKRDAGALLALEDHADKAVRKAARKAIHALRSKGVEIPTEARSWANDNLAALRRNAGPIALLDLEASPGVTRLTLSLPDPEEGATLFMGLIDPDDRVLDFGAYMQTDGQQARMARDWQRVSDDRALPIDWALARIRWGRERTFAANLPMPKALDEHLSRLGAVPSERPEPRFLDERLVGVEPSAGDLGEILMRGGVHTWPLLFDANPLFGRLSESMKDVDPATVTDGDRLSHIMIASRGDEALREALSGRIANALDDVAVALWLDGQLAETKRVRQLASELRGAGEPEAVAGVVNVVQLQITSAALQQMREQGQGHDHDHDHDHDDHDHEHHHEHDENCNDPSHHHHH